ncbi:MAG: type I DNA topoisomerase [Flavobacteriales bacterium]|nr:type I DNA topoisomerase [Flavobacteriales bacterium]MCW8913098.1 type I DNA topoisomerase [Flavobacteriales bacterium]MCW8937820.1 type I DNA topoisomerase [Flavobacteriales bacterium]MCW8939811.1 type I DNA topoisomerase [Flavobacteriales bacterium]MCW8967623.1 type I DNA topoisomerase [Flavobacteriales bacterium]
MTKNLVIVESPAKAKTIEKFLGKDFTVKSSFGHIRDLPGKNISIDIENNFEPNYVVPSDKKKIVAELKKLAKEADVVWLASDEDREGEAISWHLLEALGLDEKKTKRIVFHEITKTAITKAIENPRKINTHLVDAQQARRVLDRLVGYELSPVLWKKVRPSLSAGRVQSVAVRLIVEREREIDNFTYESAFRVIALFETNDKATIKAELPHRFKTQKEAEKFLETCNNAVFTVDDLETKPSKRSPAAPFTTSTLQQEASRKLGFSVAQTMSVAQKLYESGNITYMRTDSVNLSNDAIGAAKKEITSSYGEEFSQVRKFSTKSKGAQEAHEAIRPTYMNKHSVSGDAAQARLYDLIWKRTIASQMSDAKLEKTTITIGINTSKEKFVAKGEVLLFEGFLKVYLESSDDDHQEDEKEGILPQVKKGEGLNLNELTATEKYNNHPPRYTEASLVKKLEELGIGRPSTYAPTISTIQKRGYIVREDRDGNQRNYVLLTLKSGKISEKQLKENFGFEKKKMFPTDIGIVVTDFLVENFGKVLDYNFTARVEEQFDEIAEGLKEWSKMIAEFYKPFHDQITDTLENAERASGERLLGTDPKTKKPVIARIGRFGPMIQIGSTEDEEKPQFASLLPEQNISNITLEQALTLFQFPKMLGNHEGKEVVVSQGKFGPYIKFDEKFISLPKGEEITAVNLNRAIELIKEKQQADAPIAEYQEKPVQKGVGRFGPFIKWNNMFINVNKKYNFDNLSQSDIKELIEDKLQKEKDKFIHNWEDKGISVQKARWGRFNIVKGKTKIELPKDTNVDKMTLEDVEKIIEKQKPAKKVKKAKKKK